jgi:hypothetical protein
MKVRSKKLTILRHLENRRLKDTEHLWILRMLRPADHFPPIVRIRLFDPSAVKHRHFFISQTTEDEEKPREGARFGTNFNVYSSCYSSWGQEPISDALVRRKIMHVIAEVKC